MIFNSYVPPLTVPALDRPSMVGVKGGNVIW